MDLRQLEYVVAVADQGSFTRAARSVHVSQPSLSHGVRGLEAELGVELFSRLGRTVEVTAAGQQVIDAARRVLRDMADLTSVVASVTTLSTGTLDVVAIPTLAVDPLAQLVGQFRLDHPGVIVRVHESESPADVDRSVRSGQSELGFTDITTGSSGLVRLGLFRQEIVVVSPPGSTSDAGSITAVSLAHEPLIVTPVGTSTRRILDRMLARSGLEPNIAVEINYREAIVPLVLAGAGSALLPIHLADDAAAQGAVVKHLRPPLSRRIGVVHRQARLSPAAQAMADLATTTFS